jgi:hypothetical protein
MTPQQHQCIDHAIKNIQEARKWLDQSMYYTEPQMPEKELKRVREAYDLICKANDKL